MTEVQQNFTVYQGQDRLVIVPVVDGNNQPKVMTGGTPEAYVFDDPGDDLGDALISKTGGAISLVNYNDTDDAVQFQIDDTDTKSIDVGVYYHEIWVADATGNKQPVATGWMTLKPSPKGRF